MYDRMHGRLHRQGPHKQGRGWNMAQYADVIVDITKEKLDRCFQYRIPERLASVITPGTQVMVPFGNGTRKIRGIVVDLSNHAEIPEEKIKDIQEVDSEGISIEAQLIRLAAWIRKTYGGTMNQALKTVLPVKQKMRQKEKRTISLAVTREEAARERDRYEKKHATQFVRLLDGLLNAEEIPYETATGTLAVSASVIRKLAERGLVRIDTKTSYRDPLAFLKEENAGTEDGVTGEQKEQTAIRLNEEQSRIVHEIAKDPERPCTYLIHGVTGSGKTAVYIELIAQATKQGKQSIVLIPEIALTFQTVMRFYRRFGDRVSILHSRLSSGERYDQYLRAKNGEIDVMIGPRSALFTPFSNLGYIIIDEEHETSYKSETVPRYHAREVAIARAQICNAAVVLGSATPSIESFSRAKSGAYKLFTMDKRVEERPLPECEIIDLRAELKKGNRSILSERLTELMEDRLEKHEQTMLFLNRRGVSGFVSCRSCGHVFKCPHCDVSLSLHENGRLICHYCGYQEERRERCPECGSPYVGGFKAGTQKIEQLVRQKFPNARILRMDYDTTRTKDSYEKILQTFANHDADVLIGTQMIVKGHDFADVTLVGILAADLSLYTSDYHGAERTFQLLTQAAGRAGRGTKKGTVIIQTYNPEHYSIAFASQQNYEGFFEQELAYRRLMNYPPAAHMLVMMVSSDSQEYAQAVCEHLAGKLSLSIRKGKLPGLAMLGPAEATVAKIKDTYRQVLYCKHQDVEVLIRIKDVLEAYIRSRQELENAAILFDLDPAGGF